MGSELREERGKDVVAAFWLVVISVHDGRTEGVREIGANRGTTVANSREERRPFKGLFPNSTAAREERINPN